eukprot:10380222-Alexandrium_andersonii.AAC.1
MPASAVRWANSMCFIKPRRSDSPGFFCKRLAPAARSGLAWPASHCSDPPAEGQSSRSRPSSSGLA